jgi:hypothetical protein
LQIENNRVSDIINVQTSDSVAVEIHLSYCVSFLKEYKDSWFAINNYVKYLCDNMRSLVKREVRKYSIKDFYAKSTEIIRNIVLDTETEKELFGRFFSANGMLVNDVDIIKVTVERTYERLLENHQAELIQKSIDLADAETQMKAVKDLAEMTRQKADIENQAELYRIQRQKEEAEAEMQYKEAIQVKKREAEAAAAQAKKDLQEVLNAIQTAEVTREKEKHAAEVAHAKELAEIEKAKQEAYAATVKEIMSSISPDLIAAISASSKAELLKEGMKNMSPYAIANGESVADTVNKLMRGTSLEDVLDKASPKINF